MCRASCPFRAWLLQAAAQSAGRQLTLLREAGAAPDHPLNVSHPEGKYLSTLTFRWHDMRRQVCWAAVRRHCQAALVVDGR